MFVKNTILPNYMRHTRDFSRLRFCWSIATRQPTTLKTLNEEEFLLKHTSSFHSYYFFLFSFVLLSYFNSYIDYLLFLFIVHPFVSPSFPSVFFLYLFSSFPPAPSLTLQDTDHDSAFRGSSLSPTVQIVRKSDATRPESCFTMSRAETTKQAIKTRPY